MGPGPSRVDVGLSVLGCPYWDAAEQGSRTQPCCCIAWLGQGWGSQVPSQALSFPSLQEIDGKALLLLRSDMMMKYMGLKLGPALKLTYHIDKLKQGKF